MPAPALFWFRRDLRLSDHPGLIAAASTGGPVIPVFILDPETEALGAAHLWRLEQSLRMLAANLGEIGQRLILRKGPALGALQSLIEETGARAVHWSRLYDPVSIARDTGVKSALRESGVEAVSHTGHLLFEPWDVKTGAGDAFKVYTPFWRAVRGLDVPEAGARASMPVPAAFPRSDDLGAWHLGQRMARGGGIVARYTKSGAAQAEARLAAFLAGGISDYDRDRDRVDRDATSGLSAHLALGEISPRVCWWGGQRALEEGRRGAERFLKELVWREFAAHLMYHFPQMAETPWREAWRAFSWAQESEALARWQQGRTGEPMVDAAIRELYTTGIMHNRARMLAASYLTKHLLTDWRLGLAWFADCLVDWDPASNAMGWQWVAGCGPDAAPYFRIFNPALQAEKFDPKGEYRARWLGDGPHATAYFDAVPRSWVLEPDAPYPAPCIDLKAGRMRALAAYEQLKSQRAA